MFNNPTPRHFVSFSASDQSTIRELVDHYDGILVPGTVAAYQREGTAGFVLTMSASDRQRPYVIDPRFPLFQQGLPNIKLSHQALADVLGDSHLANSVGPDPQDFNHARIRHIARSWVEFNMRYRDQQSAKFEKYAKRLGEQLTLNDASGPQRILAPYFVANDLSDPWWQKSLEFYTETVSAVSGQLTVTRVVAAESTTALQDLLSYDGLNEVCIWVSGLDELTSDSHRLTAYGEAIRALSDAGSRSFALYGGFFAVMLASIGLGGSSHGIGYGEYRNWRELPQSGPPPARYYLPTVHRYAQQADAHRLWLHDPRLVATEPIVPPASLQYHDLMLHSVRARSEEVAEFGPLSLSQTISRLEDQEADFNGRLRAGTATQLVLRSGGRLSAHMPRWIEALRNLQGGA